MQAVVLAAGKGERLWPLTENRPKPMIPVANRPLLEHIVDALVDAGVDEIILVVGSNRERVQRHFENGDAWNVDIDYVVQDPQLGTGHALLQAERQVGESFVALNGDRIIDASLVEDVWARHEETGDPAMGVTQVEQPSQYGVVELDGETVIDIEEQPIPELAASKFINAGVYAFDPSIFAAIRRTESYGEQALTDTLSEELDDQQIRAVRYRGRWLDVSEPWDLLAVNSALIDGRSPQHRESATIADSAVVTDNTVIGDGVVVHPNATILGGVTLGDNVSVGAGAVVKNAILLSDCTIESGAIMTDCIVGANASLGPNTTVEGGTADVVLDDTVYRDVRFGGLTGDNVDVGANVTVAPGAIVGNDATVDSGTLVAGRIDDGSHVTRG
ncbi:sugar phosphate nucleotidyltransferase [Halobacterium sp. CBA1126]|uniref:sugar phosphate nucleotidyltransferase n=1 Tax=Halobacterium sp. CBA1126 TaxID=2668074 RepID=UPI0012F8318D|nr:sugar phosphate nucleotidyltransferase [Halobacterium sp. CBA1126]MUV59461.1 NTP transferase domain-containing protein [Halobacterium sp. CBA1126]